MKNPISKNIKTRGKMFILSQASLYSVPFSKKPQKCFITTKVRRNFLSVFVLQNYSIKAETKNKVELRYF